MKHNLAGAGAPTAAALASGSVLLHQIHGDELLIAAALAPLLNLSKSTVEADVTRRPDRLPPPVQIPGGRRMWLRSTVFQWLKAHEVGAVAVTTAAAPIPQIPMVVVKAKRGRGRPPLKDVEVT